MWFPTPGKGLSTGHVASRGVIELISTVRTLNRAGRAVATGMQLAGLLAGSAVLIVLAAEALFPEVF